MGLERASIVNTVTGDRVPVQFNPEEYTLNKDINYAATGVPGLSGPILQFVNGNLRTLEMELLLDTYEEHSGSNSAGDDVRVLTRRVTDLMAIDPSTHAPPVLLFVWGSLTFTCVLARASERYVMFRPDGAPVRARLTVTFNEFRNADIEAKQLKRETADYSKVHAAGQDETLAQVSWLLYGDPSAWRAIALRNGIDDPRELATGTRLVAPRLPYRDPESGEVHGASEGAPR